MASNPGAAVTNLRQRWSKVLYVSPPGQINGRNVGPLGWVGITIDRVSARNKQPLLRATWKGKKLSTAILPPRDAPGQRAAVEEKLARLIIEAYQDHTQQNEPPQKRAAPAADDKARQKRPRFAPGQPSAACDQRLAAEHRVGGGVGDGMRRDTGGGIGSGGGGASIASPDAKLLEETWKGSLYLGGEEGNVAKHRAGPFGWRGITIDDKNRDHALLRATWRGKKLKSCKRPPPDSQEEKHVVTKLAMVIIAAHQGEQAKHAATLGHAMLQRAT